jgi:hypothetical protein
VDAMVELDITVSESQVTCQEYRASCLTLYSSTASSQL